MASYNYYGIKDDYVWHLKSDHSLTLTSWFNPPRLFSDSDLVWCEGPQGGIRLMYQSFWRQISVAHEDRKIGYITKDAKAMQEFAWIKLKAKTLN